MASHYQRWRLQREAGLGREVGVGGRTYSVALTPLIALSHISHSLTPGHSSHSFLYPTSLPHRVKQVTGQVFESTQLNPAALKRSARAVTRLVQPQST